MPCMLQPSHFTCHLPSNLNDIDLFNSMSEIPASKSLGELTDSVFQVALARSLITRLQALGDCTGKPENVQLYISTLEGYLQGPPLFLRLEADTKRDLGQLVGTVMFSLCIRRILLYLYRIPIPWQGMGSQETRRGVEYSLSILSYQNHFDPELLDTHGPQDGRYWDMFHILSKGDIMHAALDVSLHAQTEGLVPWTRASLLLAIEDIKNVLLRRISKSGTDIKDLLRLSTIYQLLRSNFIGGDREAMMKEGIDDVLAACRRAERDEKLPTSEEGIQGQQSQYPPDTEAVLQKEATTIDWMDIQDYAAMNNLPVSATAIHI